MKFEKSCGCVVIDNNKVLLVKQNDGHWNFPKGHVENNETEIQTAIREVKEETNIDVIVNEKYRYTIKYNTKEGACKEVVFFLAKKVTDKIINQESEIEIAEWVEINEALDIITYDSAKNVLKKIVGIME